MQSMQCLVFAISIILGSFPVSQGVCNYNDIAACEPERPDSDCPKYRKSISCLEQLKTNCSDLYLLEITEKIKYHQSELAACPGLPDGSCYWSLNKNCMEKVDYLNPGDETCKKMKTFYNQTEQCLYDMRKDCNSKESLLHIQDQLDNFRTRWTNCQ